MGLKNGLLISHVILIENGRFYFDLVPYLKKNGHKCDHEGATLRIIFAFFNP